MSDPKDAVRLRHMLDHAREAVSLVVRKERGDLDTDRVLQLALVRLIEIVGEAARRVSDETQSRHPQIPWPQVISTRNRLVHGYDFVDHDILWETITDDLPALIAQLEQIIQ
jgi:uncharacterized protein with HEPN domain